MIFGLSITAILEIIFINIILSGDNAVVIALAARSLKPELQKKAIFWGGVAAIALRIVLTTIVAWALKIPLLQLGGGLMLFYIAVNLLKGEEESTDVKASSSIWDAVMTIVLADLVMSLDNMLAVGGASHGNMALLLIGLVSSMSIIMFCSSIIANLMNKYGWLVYIGGGILGYTAGEMILRDNWLHKIYTPSTTVEWIFPAVAAAAVLVIGYALNKRNAAAHTDSEAEAE